MSSNSTSTNPFTGMPHSANYLRLREQAQSLPVSRQLPELIELIKKHQVVMVVGEMGAGKTTQLPKALLELKVISKGKIGVTQNRRLAARMVCTYLIRVILARLSANLWQY